MAVSPLCFSCESDRIIVILFLRLREFLVLTVEIVTMINSNQAPINNKASISFLPADHWLDQCVECGLPAPVWLLADMWKHNSLNTSFISMQDINTGWRLVISNFTVSPPSLSTHAAHNVNDLLQQALTVSAEKLLQSVQQYYICLPITFSIFAFNTNINNENCTHHKPHGLGPDKRSTAGLHLQCDMFGLVKWSFTPHTAPVAATRFRDYQITVADAVQSWGTGSRKMWRIYCHSSPTSYLTVWLLTNSPLQSSTVLYCTVL